MRKKHAAHENHERWLVSYADFITLLFAFFVVMFASSQTDKAKAKEFEGAMRRAVSEDSFVASVTSILGGAPDDIGKGSAQMRGPGGVQRATNADRPPEMFHVELRPAMEYLQRELANEIARGDMSVSMEARGLVVSFQQAAFFPSGTEEIPPQAYPTVSKVAESMVRLPNPVRLEGHTDSQPVREGGRFASNWELSVARSIATMELLVRCCAVPRERLSVAGYAENAPVADNDTQEGRSRNRRVDIVILNDAGMAAEPTAAAARVSAGR